MTRVALALFMVAAVAGSAGCGIGSSSVTRVYSGRTELGPYISPEAYAHYAQGVLHENDDKLEAAIGEYQAALLDDDSSPDVWTRLGAVQCRAGKDAAASFAHAEELDPDYAPLSRERAACALAKGNARAALPLAERAVALDPDDEAASLLVIRAYEKLGRRDDARRWLWALLVRNPTSKAARDAARAAHATAPLSLPADPLGARRPDDRQAVTDDVDRALVAGDSARARALAQSAGVSPGALALRAAAIGRTSAAKREADRVLASDPNDADALIAAAVAASLDGDQPAFAHALRQLGPEPIAPSGLGVRLLGELLARRIGTTAAEAWRSAWSLPRATNKLEAAVEARGRERVP